MKLQLLNALGIILLIFIANDLQKHLADIKLNLYQPIVCLIPYTKGPRFQKFVIIQID